MKKVTLKIEKNIRIARRTFEMVLSGDVSDVKMPGQFINIKIDGFYLRRPMSISECENEKLTIIYKLRGAGTEKMTELSAGAKLDVLCAAGNGFDVRKAKGRVAVIGGGSGAAPMYGVVKALIAENGIVPAALLGFGSEDEVILRDRFEALGCNTAIATSDGSAGIKGNVTDMIEPKEFDYAFGCGPEAMLKTVSQFTDDGQYSFEARMACGYGVCFGCSRQMKSGVVRICKDGPVFEKEEIIW